MVLHQSYLTKWHSLFTLISYFVIVFQFIIMFTENWFSVLHDSFLYCLLDESYETINQSISIYFVWKMCRWLTVYSCLGQQSNFSANSLHKQLIACEVYQTEKSLSSFYCPLFYFSTASIWWQNLTMIVCFFQDKSYLRTKYKWNKC